MRNIIQNIFTKTTNISKKDIEKFILESQIKESLDLEYKSIDYLKKGFSVEERGNKIDKKEDVLIKPLVAFLNKLSEEGGLLVLGIHAEDAWPKKIAAAKKGLFTPEQIRSWIHQNISSIPPAKDFPRINVIDIDQSLFLIEIHPLDIHTVYFSKISNTVYIRKNDTSNPLPLPEVYELISKKICATVFLDIREKEKKLEESITKIQLEFRYINEGAKPGEYVRSKINFKLLKGDSKKVKIDPIKGWRKGIKELGALCAFEADRWEKDIIYPEVPMFIGGITIVLGKDEELFMQVWVWEKEGRSYQAFVINFQRIVSGEKDFKRYTE